MYGLHGKLKATSGNGDKLASILLEASQVVKDVKGCHLYLVSKGKDEKDCIWVTEVWDTREDHDCSLKIESIKTLIKQAIPLIDGQPGKGQELEILGGAGIK